MYNNLHCAASRNFTIIQPSKFIPEPWFEKYKMFNFARFGVPNF